MSARTPASFLQGGGEAASLIAAFDWSKTAVGPLESWSAGMKSTVALVVRSHVPLVTLWGEPGVMIYNDAYAVFAGGRHPRLLGSNVREGWPEVADFNDNVMRVGLAGGTLSYRDQELTLHRHGKPEQVWMNLDYSPLLDENGMPVGVIAIVAETTAANLDRIALEQVANQLQRAQEAGGVGLFSIDVAEDIIHGTPEFFRIFGFGDRQSMSASDIEPLVLPDDLQTVSSSARRRTGEGALDVEYRIRRPDTGELRYIARKGEFERDAQGRPVRFVGVVTDVTERRAEQRALKASEAQFRTFAQSMPNQVWTSAPTGQLDWFNERVFAYSGLSAAQLQGNGWASVVHPDDRAKAAEVWAQSLQTGETYETEFRLRRADGEYRWHLARAIPISAPGGDIERWIGTNTDIHEQKLAEAENARDRDRMWSLSQDLLLVCDKAGLITAINPSAARLLGWDAQEMVGQPLLDFVHPDDRAASAAEVAKVAAGAKTLTFENRYRAKDGSYRLFDWTAVPDGDRIHGVGRDVTEQRNTEDALRQSQKMEAVGQLTGGIAHDFNNLLQGITGNLELLQRRLDQGRTDTLHKFAQGAMQSAKRAAALTHRLLAFSRRQPLDPRPVQANPLVSSMEDLLRRTLREGIDLAFVLAAGLWTTKCDANQLESAILNLVINARDAMPHGGKLVIETCNAHLDSAAVARQRDIRPGEYICISVSDTGIGMAPETISRAFEPFFTTKPIGQGTGLGLSMIYGFARQSEGYATIASELGKGTTVKLYLPRFRGEAEEEDALPELTDDHATTEGETVLVVEDEHVVRGLIVEVLTELGYRAIEASDGPAGLEILRSPRRIDLLITDIGLPGLNGRQVAEAGRALRPALKILFMTGYAENAALASGFLEPGMAMVTKPFAMEALATRIRDIIEG